MDPIRAWKDPAYRLSLGANAPAHPAGDVGLVPITDDELAAVDGAGTADMGTMGCCGPNWTWYTMCSVICIATALVC